MSGAMLLALSPGYPSPPPSLNGLNPSTPIYDIRFQCGSKLEAAPQLSLQKGHTISQKDRAWGLWFRAKETERKRELRDAQPYQVV